MNNLEWQERRNKVVANGMGNVLPTYIAKGRNAMLTDIEGKEYIDFGAGIAVNNTGHSHPQIVDAVKEQLDNFSHTCSILTPYTSFVELAEKLAEIAPGEEKKKAVFLTTGAEAVENAIKIARAHTGRRGIIAFNGAFHGRTNMCMGLTGKVAPYKVGFGPFPNDIYHLPYPNQYHGVSEQSSLDALNSLISVDIQPEEIAAMIFEPIQGEGGFYSAPAQWAQEMRSFCDKHGIVLICDEIQTGFARTGKMFASEYLGMTPDITTMAKGMAGGFPLSAVVGKADIMDSACAGGLGGTYAGSPLACVAALKVLELIESEKLCDRANAVGAQFKELLTQLQNDIAEIGDIRQVGAMIAMELDDPDTKEPLKNLTKALVQKAGEAGLILLSCGVKGNVIRFLPPLTIEPELIEKGLNIMEEQLRNLINSRI